MSEKLIVVRLKPNHPSWSRRRAGFCFNEIAQAIEVSKSKEDIIKNDNCLLVITKGTAYKEAVKIYKGSKKDIIQDDKKDIIQDDKKEQEPKTTQDEKKGKEVSKMNKLELVEALKQAGLEENKDFNAAAPMPALKELLEASL